MSLRDKNTQTVLHPAETVDSHMEGAVQRARRDLLAFVSSSLPHVDCAKVKEAVDFAYVKHLNQKRASGEPYILHPIAVAQIIAELHLDTTSIVVALLHDVIEDCDCSVEEVSSRFGETEAELVSGVTKLGELGGKSERVKEVENLRKLLMAMSKDIRVLLVKLADRLHNMRTIGFISNPYKRMRIALESVEIYAPLAERIGLHALKGQLHDLTFQELYPEIRASIISRLVFLRQHSEAVIQQTLDEIIRVLRDNGIEAEVTGREKSPYSIWRKMQAKKAAFEQLSDIFAFRVIVNTTNDCYRALGYIHTEYRIVQNSFEDYISNPKINGYQSLHTVVIGPNKRPIEIQIRSREMHSIAEFGVAAHWSYKQQAMDQNFLKQYRWLQKLREIFEDTYNPDNVMNNTKLEMHYDEVFCFTPSGDLIALSQGATPVDFAFAVSTAVGLTCVGAIVNGRPTPLRVKLENGDQVEIIRAEKPAVSAFWENLVVTGKARNEIRQYLDNRYREEFESLGRALLSIMYQKVKKQYNELELMQVLGHFNKKTLGELLIDVGNGKIQARAVLIAAHPSLHTTFSKVQGMFSFMNNWKRKKGLPKVAAINIGNMTQGVGFHLASCCSPLQGEDIAGITYEDHGIEVHTSNCALLYSEENNSKIVPLVWGDDAPAAHIARFRMMLMNRVGSMAAVTKVIADHGINIINFKIHSRSTDFFELMLDLEMVNKEAINGLVESLRTSETTYSIEKVE